MFKDHTAGHSGQRKFDSDFHTFEAYESNVRSYCRDFPVIIGRAKGSVFYSVDEKPYIDFFMGAGGLNYGHNCDKLKEALLAYLTEDGITHSLDFHTNAKREFIEAFQAHILLPRGFQYKFQFTGPTGTNAVEAALKLARKVTGRTNVIAFTNAFHGMSLGALSATAAPKKRGGAGVPLSGVTFMPFPGQFGPDVDTMDYISQMLAYGSGIDAPAAFLVETIQGEGGLRSVDQAWLQRLFALAKSLGALVIIDEIQSGCGRSGSFFSFDAMGVEPDIVCLSKSLSAYGLPFSMNLIKPEHDTWEPGEHNGTFRGNNLAFVTAKAAIETYWVSPDFKDALAKKIRFLDERMQALATQVRPFVPNAEVRGRGFMQGLYLADGQLATRVSQAAFERGLIVETCGPHGEVVKLLPALTIEEDTLAKGLELLASAFECVLQSLTPRRQPEALWQ